MLHYLGRSLGIPSLAFALPHKLDPVRFGIFALLDDSLDCATGSLLPLALMLFEWNILKSSGFLYFCKQNVGLFLLLESVLSFSFCVYKQVNQCDIIYLIHFCIGTITRSSTRVAWIIWDCSRYCFVIGTCT